MITHSLRFGAVLLLLAEPAAAQRAPALRADGTGRVQRAPTAARVSLPAPLTEARRRDLTGGQPGIPYVSLSLRNLHVPGKGTMNFAYPAFTDVHPGSGPNSISGINMRPSGVDEMGGPPRVVVDLVTVPGDTYLVDCRVGLGTETTFTVDLGSGVQQTWPSSAAGGHLAFVLQATSNRSGFSVRADQPWYFLGCEVFAL